MYRRKAENSEKNRAFASSNFNQDVVLRAKKLYDNVKHRYKLTATELLSKLEEEEILIPSCVFNKRLSTFESIVKYLRENLMLPNREIALLISKSQKSIWQTYNSAKKKHPYAFDMKASECYIPVSVIRKPFTVLESIVRYLKEDLSFNLHKIAVVLSRDDRTIWTVYDRARKKNGL